METKNKDFMLSQKLLSEKEYIQSKIMIFAKNILFVVTVVLIYFNWDYVRSLLWVMQLLISFVLFALAPETPIQEVKFLIRPYSVYKKDWEDKNVTK